MGLFREKGELSRQKITRNIPEDKRVSRITIIRDLKTLQELGFVKSKGKAKATLYTLRTANPFLEYIDINSYFDLDITERGAKNKINQRLFGNLTSLYNDEERALWEKSAKEFKKRSNELDKTIYKRELERFMIELSWKSSQIEGNTYDLLETETLIKQRIEAAGHPKEEAIMILNHKDAFETILNKRLSFKKLSMADVIQLYNVLAKNLEISTGIRAQRVRITGTVYEPMHNRHDLEEALKRLISHINKVDYPPEKALIAGAMIAYIQPFSDGNKRTSRMLANAILLAHGYFPLSYRSVDVNEYRKAIILFYEQNNLYHFKRIFIEQLRFALENYFLV